VINLSEEWAFSQPSASAGLLAVKKAPNRKDHPGLKQARLALEEELRSNYGAMDRKSLREMPVYAAYDAFYRSFKKTYHVQLQLESVVFKGKQIFSPSALVACMFMAELKTGLLTAAHDFKALIPPLVADLALGHECYLRLDGTEQVLKRGDMYIRDQEGILSSVIYGPDQRTQIQMDTDQAVFTTYGPPGIDKGQVQAQLEVLESYIKIFAPSAERTQLVVV
jgi:DNA/RNA-binding domain of Phe-tRNA-synthetase-like protein